MNEFRGEVYFSPDSGKVGGPPKKEAQPVTRSFKEIKADLLQEQDEDKVLGFQVELGRLIRKAEDVGVFDDIRGETDEWLKKYTKGAGYFGLMSHISTINCRLLEAKAKEKEGWEDEFSGLIEEYNHLMVSHMQYAYLDAVNREGRISDDDKEEIRKDLGGNGLKDYIDRLEGFGISKEVYSYADLYLREELDREAQASQKNTTTTEQGGGNFNEEVLQELRMGRMLTQEEVQLMKKSGFRGLVSAMNARAGINVQTFDTESPVWYDQLSEDWQNIIRLNLGVLLGSYVKNKEKVEGMELLLKSSDIEIRREYLANAWENVPGFRVAFTTMMHDFFDPRFSRTATEDGKNAGYAQLSENGVEQLKDLSKYRRELFGKIKSYLGENQDLLDYRNNDGGPRDLSVETAARFAVSSALNLIYLSGSIESGDAANSYVTREVEINGASVQKPDEGKNLKDVFAFNPSVRVFSLPRYQARSKYIKGEEDPEGTDEAWGGKTGEWFAERLRTGRDDEFRRQFDANEGVTRIIPERMAYGLFDLTVFSDKETMTNKLIRDESALVNLGNGLWDYKEGEIDFNKLKFSEIWGGYTDTLDSSYKVYTAIIGKADQRDFDRQKLGNALSKVRKEGTGLISRIFTGESGEWVLTGAIVGLCGGPIQGTSEIVLSKNDSEYDVAVNTWLGDERVLGGLPRGARKRILSILHAKDNTTLGSYMKGMVKKSTPLVGERSRLRLEADASVASNLRDK